MFDSFKRRGFKIVHLKFCELQVRLKKNSFSHLPRDYRNSTIFLTLIITQFVPCKRFWNNLSDVAAGNTLKVKIFERGDKNFDRLSSHS